MVNKKGCASKEISNVMPLNGITYKTKCSFFSLMFSIMRHYDRPIEPFLLDAVICYDLNIIQKTPCITQKSEEIHGIDNLCLQFGFVIKGIPKCDNVIPLIIDALNRGCPVILVTDAYYEPSRPDLYKLRHKEHYIAIYGYDEYERMFQIVEQVDEKKLIFEKTSLSFNDVEMSYKQGLRITNDENTYHEFTSNTEHCYDIDKSLLNYFRQYQKAVLKKKEKIYKSIKNIQKYSLLMYNYLSSDDFFQEFKLSMLDVRSEQNMLYGLHEIIDNKKAERFALNNILGQQCDIVDFLNKNIKTWEKVRAAIIKYIFTKKINLADCKVISKLIEDTYNSEINYYNILYKYNQI